MNLLRFKIKNFRAAVDSDWIECDRVTAFVGTNEAGKTTTLLALMKFADQNYRFNIKPETLKSKQSMLYSGLGKLMQDVPLDRAEELLPQINTTIFIETVFSLSQPLSDLIYRLGGERKRFNEIYITKTYGGHYDLPEIFKYIPDEHKNEILKAVLAELPNFLYFKEVTEIRSEIDFVDLAYKLAGLKSVKELTQRETIFANLLRYLDIWQSNLIKSITQIYGDLAEADEKKINFIELFEKIPMFKDRFDRGFAELTVRFKKWWGSNEEMKIYYEPYKKGIRIRLTDEHGESFLLENRSTGFRRFFSLFLSFSVSALEDEDNTIMLFDEAGAALHPKMQRKLIEFFGKLGTNCQVLYNTHTLYMLPASEMNRTRLVYKDSDGHIKITRSLRVTSNGENEESLFIAQSALIMNVSERMLAGCMPVVLLSESDELYLNTIKNILTAIGKFNSVQTILMFSTGENGIDSTAEAFSQGGDYPVILLPSDQQSKQIKDRLLKDKYKNVPHKVLELGGLFKKMVKFEDLIPSNFIEIFNRKYLADILGAGFRYDSKKDLIEQIEEYAKNKEISLPENYRVEMAKRMKINTMLHFEDVHIPPAVINNWIKLWRAILR